MTFFFLFGLVNPHSLVRVQSEHGAQGIHKSFSKVAA